VDPGEGDPGVCGGHVDIYLEPFMPSPTVLTVGSGHVGKAVVELAHWLGFRTVVADDRAEEVAEDVVPLADVRVAGTMGDVLGAIEITRDTAVVLVSRSVDYDVGALPLLLDSPARYIGVMGSSRRWTTTRSRLLGAGVTEAALAQVRAPIGREIGAETVQEIAVSIMAQVIAAFRVGEAG
jgi:xanthine dehydrogenase accessory factor